MFAAVLAQRDGGDDRLRDAPALHAAPGPCGVEPRVAPALPAERPGPELVDLGVERGAHGRCARAGHRVEPRLARHGLDLPGRHALHVHLGDRGGRGGVGAAPAPRDVVGEVGALPELGDLERELPGGGGRPALAVAVPRARAPLGELPQGAPHASSACMDMSASSTASDILAVASPRSRQPSSISRSTSLNTGSLESSTLSLAAIGSPFVGTVTVFAPMTLDRWPPSRAGLRPAAPRRLVHHISKRYLKTEVPLKNWTRFTSLTEKVGESM